MTNRSNSAVLLVPAANRLFALAFGYGRGLLAADSFEENFGLRVTLNAVPEDGIRTISRKTLDAFAHHTQTQAIRSGRLPQFGVDLEQDLLRAVTGTPADATLGKRLVGRDTLAVLTTATPRDLQELFARLLAEFKSKAYRRKYPDLDQMSEEQDPSIIEALEAKLLKRIAGDELERLWLAVPELINWETIEGFRYRPTGEELYDDLHFSEFLRHVRDPSDLTVERLKQKHAFAIDGHSHEPRDGEHWSVFKCIHAEIQHNQLDYVLSSGKWFRLRRSFVETVDKFIDAIPRSTIRFPLARNNEDEKAYNARAAAQITGCIVMDRDNVPHGGGQSSIEFCDLLTSRGQMIHVKKYAGSGVLSHLFNQGNNAAEILVRDRDFRDKVQGRLPTSHKRLVTNAPIKTADYEIVYAIIGRQQGSRSLSQVLPFFSRLSLRRATHRLQSAGFKVSVAWIPRIDEGTAFD